MDKIRNRIYDTPTQVAFWDYDGGHWVGGIAFDTVIICGDCGGVFDIDEIYEFAPEGINPIHPFEEWVDISAEIIGYAPGSEEMENLGKDDETIVVIS